eukprot:CAMPEP_0170176478 /NCGR_PEP_ID=MMETSP0040_2-20121228/9351_1 /TAXON_ID=641309 /ORGANISM="Lotharella oceanica, Strain CCMP622" /LENGTH=349 /DNA_ID=CAMNT_0010418821 /DNA_START=166 /DNA_END=1215 /DNA_ORIENTATION=-
MGDRKVKEPSGGCFRTLARIGTLLKYDEAKNFLNLLAVVYSLFVIASVLLAFTPTRTDLEVADQRYLDIVVGNAPNPPNTADFYYNDAALVHNDDYPSQQFYRWSLYDGRRMNTERVGSLAAEGQNGYGAWSSIFRNKQEQPEFSSVVQLPSFRLFWYSMQSIAMFVGGVLAIIWIRFMHLFLAEPLGDRGGRDARGQAKRQPNGPRHLTFASWFSLVFELIVFALCMFSAFAFWFFTELLRVAVQIQNPRVNAEALVTEYLQDLAALVVVPVAIVMLWGIVSIVCGCCLGWVGYAPQSPWDMMVPVHFEEVATEEASGERKKLSGVEVVGGDVKKVEEAKRERDVHAA